MLRVISVGAQHCGNLFIHIPQTRRTVHDQRALQLGPFQYVCRVDVFGVKWRVFAHQNRVAFAELPRLLRAPFEPALRIIEHPDRRHFRPGNAVAQEQGPEFGVQEPPAFGLRGEHHRQRAVLGGFDVLDRVHDDEEADGGVFDLAHPPSLTQGPDPFPQGVWAQTVNHYRVVCLKSDPNVRLIAWLESAGYVKKPQVSGTYAPKSALHCRVRMYSWRAWSATENQNSPDSKSW